MSIYRKHAQFCVPGSPKAENYRAIELPSREFLFKNRIVDRRGKPNYTLKDLGIKINQKVKFRRPTYNVVPISHKTGIKHMKMSYSRLNLGLSNDAIVALIVRMLRNHGDSSTRVVVDSEGRFVGRNGVSGRKCLVAGEHNASDNCWFRISGGVVHYHCFDDLAHEYCASTVIGVLKEAPVFKDAKCKDLPSGQ